MWQLSLNVTTSTSLNSVIFQCSSEHCRLITIATENIWQLQLTKLIFLSGSVHSADWKIESFSDDTWIVINTTDTIIGKYNGSFTKFTVLFVQFWTDWQTRALIEMCHNQEPKQSLQEVCRVLNSTAVTCTLPPGPARRSPCGSGTCRAPRTRSPPSRRWRRKRWRTAVRPPACEWRWWPWRPSHTGGPRSGPPGPPGRVAGSGTGSRRPGRRGPRGGRGAAHTQPGEKRSWLGSMFGGQSVRRTGGQHINNTRRSGVEFQNKSCRDSANRKPSHNDLFNFQNKSRVTSPKLTEIY